MELQQRAQYDRLDQVVSANVHGLSVQDLYIFSTDGKVSYAMDKENVGREDLAGESVTMAANEGRHSFEIRTRRSLLWAMFQWELEPGSVTLKTTFPLRAERGLTPRSALSGPIMGVLQFSQDITEDYKSVIHFQWVIISTSLVSSLVLFFILMTIIKRAERTVAERMVEKERLERELHQSERLASMGRVVATIAHEVRNPLGIIRSSAELLLKRSGGENDPQTKIIRAVYDESMRLSKTVNDFLDYARPKQPRQDRVDLSKVLDQALGFLDPECAKREVVVERALPGRAGCPGRQGPALPGLLQHRVQRVAGHGSSRDHPHRSPRTWATRGGRVRAGHGPGL